MKKKIGTPGRVNLGQVYTDIDYLQDNKHFFKIGSITHFFHAQRYIKRRKYQTWLECVRVKPTAALCYENCLNLPSVNLFNYFPLYIFKPRMILNQDTNHLLTSVLQEHFIRIVLEFVAQVFIVCQYTIFKFIGF